MITDDLCALLADLLINRRDPATASREIIDGFTAIGDKWPASLEMPERLRDALTRPASLGIVELDQAAIRLQSLTHKLPSAQPRLMLITLLLAQFGAPNCRRIAGQYYMAALFPPSVVCLDGALGYTLDSANNHWQATSDLPTKEAPEADSIIDGCVLAACELARMTYEYYRRAEHALSEMPQSDSHFMFSREHVAALERDCRNALSVACNVWALTPAGRLAKAELAEDMMGTEPLSLLQKNVGVRFAGSLARDLERAKRQGWSPPW